MKVTNGSDQLPLNQTRRPKGRARSVCGTASAPQRHSRRQLVPKATKHILQGVLPPAIHDMITCSKQTTCSPLAFHQKGALGKCQDEHEGHHPSAQEGPHRLLKSIIDGSDLFAPRHGAESPAARSTRVVLCRAASNGIPLPLLLYRVWKAQSDVGCLLGGVPDQRGQGTEAAPTTRSWSPALRYR